MNFIFLLTGLALVWIFLLYDLTLCLLCLGFTKKISTSINHQAKISVIVPTFNEEADIARKISNLLEDKFPKEDVEIIIVDSDSTDKTVEIASSFANVIILLDKPRSGKTAAIDKAFRIAKNEIILVTDANCFFEGDTLRRVISYFADPSVGGVTAGMTNPISSNNIFNYGGRFYWSMDRRIKKRESALHSTVGMIGELMAFRASILKDVNYKEWACNNGADDTSLSYFIIKKGYRVVLAGDIIIKEKGADTYNDIFMQRGRVIAHNIHNTISELGLLGLKYGLYSALIFPTRRILALLCPFLLILNLIASLYLYCVSYHALYLSALIAHLAIYLFAIPIFRSKMTDLCHHFVLLNLMILYGWYIYCTNNNLNIWCGIKSSRGSTL